MQNTHTHSVGIFIHKLAHKRPPQTLLSGWLLTPEDDSSLTDLLLILGESLNSCCSRHVCGYLRIGALGGGPQFTKATNSSSSQKIYCWTSDFFELSLPFSLQSFSCLSLTFSLAPLFNCSPLSHLLLLLSSHFCASSLLLWILSLPAASLSAVVQLCCTASSATLPTWALMPETMSSSRKSKVGQADRWGVRRGGGSRADISREAQTHGRPMWCTVPRNVYIMQPPS